MAAMLGIGEVAARSGLAASAIRYYEGRGLLPEAIRRSGRRLYPPSILARLTVIELAKIAGFDLEEIRIVLTRAGAARPAQAWREWTDAKAADIDAQMKRLSAMKEILAGLRGCACATLEDCGRMFAAARAERPPEPALSPRARRRSSGKRLAARRRARRG